MGGRGSGDLKIGWLQVVGLPVFRLHVVKWTGGRGHLIGKGGVQRFFQTGKRRVILQGIVLQGVVGNNCHCFGHRSRCRISHRRLTQQDCDRLAVAVHSLAGGQQRFGGGGRSEKGFADKGAVFGDCNEGHRVQPVRGGKTLSLGKGLAGDDGDLDRSTLARPVEHQILDRIGRAAFQCRRDLAALVVAAGTGGFDFGVKDLAVGQDHLAGHAKGRQAKGGLAQVIQPFGHIGGVKGDIPDGQPALRGPVQKRDGVAREVKCECRFHALGLTRKIRGRERRPDGCRTTTAAFRRREGKRPRIGLRRASQV